MRKANCGITPEGWPCIGLTAFAAMLSAMHGCCWILTLIFFLACCFSLHFFRDPERVPPQQPDVAASPADGKIVLLDSRSDPFTGEMLTCVSIFMNVFSVHVNRAPVAGEICAINYWPGKFFNASLDKASTDNERCAWKMRDSDGRDWTVVQIAGLIARRIVCRGEVGDKLAMGERFGMIRFGSRVDVYLPPDFTPTVKIGDRVFAGQSVIARKA